VHKPNAPNEHSAQLCYSKDGINMAPKLAWDPHGTSQELLQGMPCMQIPQQDSKELSGTVVVVFINFLELLQCLEPARIVLPTLRHWMQGCLVLSRRSFTRDSSLARVMVMVKCLGPLQGMEVSESMNKFFLGHTNW
jgi:hypothetical protein